MHCVLVCDFNAYYFVIHEKHDRKFLIFIWNFGPVVGFDSRPFFRFIFLLWLGTFFILHQKCFIPKIVAFILHWMFIQTILFVNSFAMVNHICSSLKHICDTNYGYTSLMKSRKTHNDFGQVAMLLMCVYLFCRVHIQSSHFWWNKTHI